MMHIGFTGSRDGMSDPQRARVQAILAHLIQNVTHGPMNVVAHHGDCVGADAEFHRMCRAFGVAGMFGHPPVDPKHRAWCAFDWQVPPKTHFARNRDIVDGVSFMIATPGHLNKIKGGTWYTAGYADRQKRPLWCVLPEGAVVESNVGSYTGLY